MTILGSTRLQKLALRIFTISMLTVCSISSSVYAQNPSVPGNLRFAVYSNKSAEIFWDRATDNSIVVGYEIQVNNDIIGTLDATSYYSNTYATGANYTVSVTSIDSDGNRSENSTVSFVGGDRDAVSMPPVIQPPVAEPPVEGVGPVAPTGVRATVYSTKTFELFWERVQTNVLEYEIYLNAALVDTTFGTSSMQRNVQPDTQYEIEIVAVDIVGNKSAPTAIIIRTDGEPIVLEPENEVPPTTLPPAPKNAQLIVYSRKSAELFWERASAMENIVNNEIKRDGVLIGETDGTSYYDNSRAYGVGHRYEVTAINATGARSPSTFIGGPDSRTTNPGSTDASATDSGITDSGSTDFDTSVGDREPMLLMPKCGTNSTQLLASRVNNCLAAMTLEEKIGQMVMGDHLELKSDDHVLAFKLGALLAGGGHAPTTGNMAVDWAKMVDKYQQDALSTRLGIPILFGTDAVHGHSNVFGTTIFPHNIGLGATRNAALACEVGRITAREVAATGINWTFSPSLCVSRDERWGRSYECFSEDPAIPTMMTSIIGGLQGTGSCTELRGLGTPNIDGARDSILATAKHWVGDGGTFGGVDQGDTNYQDLESIHIPPYLPAIVDQDVGSVMVSYNSVDGVKMHANPGNLIDNTLRSKLNFSGIVLSDWAAIKQINQISNVAIRTAIKGGIDMAMEPYNYDSFIWDLLEEVNAGNVSMDRINDAVTRILTAKVKLGLFDPPYGRTFTDDAQLDPTAQYSLMNDIGTPAHRDVARQVVRESLVLLKNDGDLLPLPKSTGSKPFNVLVAGKSADNIGNQAGGWTISWQGDSGDITLGDTVYDGVVELLAGRSSNVTVELKVEPQSGVVADVGIVVVGETPYAEGQGDDSTLTLSNADNQAINHVCNSMDCVVVIMSGRPLIITDLIDNDAVNAIVAAWLPGTEGKGVAEVLFGDSPFTGTLPVSWPKSMDQIPVNVGDDEYGGADAPLFRIGYGLLYTTSP